MSHSISVDIANDFPADLGRNISIALDAVLPRAVDAIDATDINISVALDPSRVIPETGAGGATDSPNKISVWIDPSNANLQEHFAEVLQSTVVHELHHAMRNRTVSWPGTLLDDIVGEGLADHFDVEINGSHPRPWAHALSDKELEEYYALAKPRFAHRNTEDDYYTWVLGSEQDGIPRWAGYALGYKIVGDYLAKTGRKASELVQTDSADFIK